MKSGRSSRPGSTDATSTTFRFVMAVLVFLVLLTVAAKQFSAITDIAQQTEIETSIQYYADSVAKVHQQWELQGRPQAVIMTGIDNATLDKGDGNNDSLLTLNSGSPVNSRVGQKKQWIFIMNHFGWPIDVKGSQATSPCAALWYGLQPSDRFSFVGELVHLRGARLASDSQDNDSLGGSGNGANIQVCRNLVDGWAHFTYRLDTGRVEVRQQ